MEIAVAIFVLIILVLIFVVKAKPSSGSLSSLLSNNDVDFDSLISQS